MNTALVGAVRWRGVGVFLLLAFGFSWLVWIGLRAAGVPFVVRAALGMFGPALAATLVRGPLLREGFADAGLRPHLDGGGWRPYLAAYLVAPALLAAGMLFALATGSQGWSFDAAVRDFAATMREALVVRGRSPPSGMSVERFASLLLVVNVVQAFTLALPINMLFTFGEEFGWRGYLLPRLLPLGPTRASLLVGVLWGAWHAPLIVLDGYNYPGHPALGVGAMALFTSTWSVVFTWVSLRSGSVWPAVLLHAALNAQGGFAVLFLAPTDALARAPLGLLGVLPVAAFALWLVRTGRLLPSAASRAPSPPAPMSP